MTELVPERIPNHGWRIAGIWLVLTAISVPLIVLVLGLVPHARDTCPYCGEVGT